jgi:hypothetical protein
MESREIRCFPASIGIWIYVMIRLQRQIGNSRSFTNKVWGKLAHAKSVTALPHEFVYSRDRELSRACTPSIAPDTIKFALPGNSMGDLLLFDAVHRGFFKDEGLDIELPRLIPAMAQNALWRARFTITGLPTPDSVSRRAACR